MIPIFASETHQPDLNAAVGAFVSQQVFGHVGGIERFCSMAVLHDDKAGVIELTSASIDKRWLTRRVIRAMMHMAFDMIGAQLAVLRVAETNTGMVEIARRFGFKGVLIPRLKGPTEGDWIFTLTVEDWRASGYA